MKDKLKKQKKKIIAGIIFLFIALYMSTLVPTVQMSWMMGLLVLTIYLFAFEVPQSLSWSEISFRLLEDTLKRQRRLPTARTFLPGSESCKAFLSFQLFQ